MAAIPDGPPERLKEVNEDTYKILVADDEPTIRELMQLVLEHDGHTVKTANDGEQALKMLQEERFDFLLSDIQMPCMDGIELLRRAKALYPDMTAILITGFGTIETAVEAMKSGASDFLTKPIREPDQIPLIFRRAKRFHLLQNEVKALRELNRLQDEFLALLSHELRTPLTSIRGCLDAMQDLFRDEISDNVMEMLSAAAEGVTALSRIVESLLLIAGLQNDRILLDKQRVGLVRLLEDVSERILTAGEGKAELLLETAGDEVLVDVDYKLFTRAVGNIIENAVKFNPGKEDLRITARVSDKDGTVYLSISNNGRPIREEDREEIFRRFKQEEHYMTRTCEGMGLGLPITRTIVEKHGGEIKVSCNDEEEVTFDIELPTAR